MQREIDGRKAKGTAAASPKVPVNKLVQNLEAEIKKKDTELKKKSVGLTKLEKSEASAAEPDDGDDEVEAVGESGNKERIEAVIAEIDVEIKNTVAAEKTSAGKPRQAARLVTLRAEKKSTKSACETSKNP